MQSESGADALEAVRLVFSDPVIAPFLPKLLAIFAALAFVFGYAIAQQAPRRPLHRYQ